MKPQSWLLQKHWWVGGGLSHCWFQTQTTRDFYQSKRSRMKPASCCMKEEQSVLKCCQLHMISFKHFPVPHFGQLSTQSLSCQSKLRVETQRAICTLLYSHGLDFVLITAAGDVWKASRRRPCVVFILELSCKSTTFMFNTQTFHYLLN